MAASLGGVWPTWQVALALPFLAIHNGDAPRGACRAPGGALQLYASLASGWVLPQPLSAFHRGLATQDGYILAPSWGARPLRCRLSDLY